MQISYKEMGTLIKKINPTVITKTTGLLNHFRGGGIAERIGVKPKAPIKIGGE